MVPVWHTVYGSMDTDILVLILKLVFTLNLKNSVLTSIQYLADFVPPKTKSADTLMIYEWTSLPALSVCHLYGRHETVGLFLCDDISILLTIILNSIALGVVDRTPCMASAVCFAFKESTSISNLYL